MRSRFRFWSGTFPSVNLRRWVPRGVSLVSDESDDELSTNEEETENDESDDDISDDNQPDETSDDDDGHQFSLNTQVYTLDNFNKLLEDEKKNMM